MIITEITGPSRNEAGVMNRYLDRMRIFRNSTRGWNTHNHAMIYPDEQAAWWDSRGDSVRAWVVVDSEGEVMIDRSAAGYGMLSKRNGRWYVSMALMPPARGLGLGTGFLKFLCEQVKGKVWVELWDWNEAGIALVQKLGFEPSQGVLPDVAEPGAPRVQVYRR